MILFTIISVFSIFSLSLILRNFFPDNIIISFLGVFANVGGNIEPIDGIALYLIPSKGLYGYNALIPTNSQDFIRLISRTIIFISVSILLGFLIWKYMKNNEKNKKGLDVSIKAFISSIEGKLILVGISLEILNPLGVGSILVIGGSIIFSAIREYKIEIERIKLGFYLFLFALGIFLIGLIIDSIYQI